MSRRTQTFILNHCITPQGDKRLGEQRAFYTEPTLPNRSARRRMQKLARKTVQDRHPRGQAMEPKDVLWVGNRPDGWQEIATLLDRTKEAEERRRGLVVLPGMEVG